MKMFLGVPIFAASALVLWMIAFHDPDDPKNLLYQCWKVGICSINLDQAIHTMVLDSRRDGLVVGKTEGQIIRKFGFVTSLNEASDYIKKCYDNPADRGTRVLFLRHSEWAVTMENGRAVKIVFVKGC
jgi:hypothetical protein